jgi:hypothetical protein
MPLPNAFAYLGVAGSITTAVGLLALLALIGYGLARLEIKRKESNLSAAIQSGNETIVTATLRRFSIRADNLTKKQAYDVAIRQIRGDIVVTFLRYVSILVTVLCFFGLMAYLLVPSTITSPSLSGWAFFGVQENDGSWSERYFDISGGGTRAPRTGDEVTVTGDVWVRVSPIDSTSTGFEKPPARGVAKKDMRFRVRAVNQVDPGYYFIEIEPLSK